MNDAELKRLVGSLFVVGFEGTKLPDYMQQWVEDWDLLGFILFKKNIANIEELKQLNHSLQSLRSSPVMISVDHEGGRVFRLPEPFTKTAPMQDLGERIRATGNYDLAFEHGALLAREIFEVGFNVNYAPIADVNTETNNPIIGDRAVSTNPHEVAEILPHFLQGMASAQVLGCAKHFPGHGDTLQDSHLDLPVVNKSLEQLRACELVPFQACIAAKVPLIMTAHVIYPQVDQRSASLSRFWLHDILREELGYEGCIISDDLIMQGVRKDVQDHMTQRVMSTAPISDIALAAEAFIRAGGDIVLICHEPAQQEASLNYLFELAKNDIEFRNLCLIAQKRVKQLQNSIKTKL